MIKTKVTFIFTCDECGMQDTVEYDDCDSIPDNPSPPPTWYIGLPHTFCSFPCEYQFNCSVLLGEK